MLISQENQGIPQANVLIADTVAAPATESVIWSKFIPRANMVFLVISAIFVFGIDLMILISSPNLIGFWIEMLIVFGVFILFMYIENFKLSKRFASTKSRLDFYIGALVVIRNLAIFLNFIPYIQILGMLILVFAGVPYLIGYLLLLRFRSKA